MSATVAGAALAVVLIAPWSGSASLAHRALGAVGKGPVLHVVVDQPQPGPTHWYQPISLPSGTSIPVTMRREIWFDRSLNLTKTVTSLKGFVVSRLVETPDGDFDSHGPYEPTGRPVYVPPPTPEPALAGFLDQYRSALGSGRATKIGTGHVGGHQVIWLRIVARPADFSPTEEVAIDASTYAPLLVRTADRNAVRFTVKQIGAQAYEPSLFAHPHLQYPVVTTTIGGTTPIEAARATSLLGGYAVWLGRTWNGYRLVSVEQKSLVDGYPPHSGKAPVHSVGVVLVYAPPGDSLDSAGVLRITESERCETGLEMPCGNAPPPTDDVLRLGVGPFASLTLREGLYVAISQTGAKDAVAVANALRPLG